MSLPWVGGYVWITFGYQYVFIGGMAVVLGSILVASKIRLTKDILNNNEI
jgi:hypothetical protein